MLNPTKILHIQKFQLKFDGVTIEELSVLTNANENVEALKKPENNTLYTFKEKNSLKLTGILNPNDTNPLYVLFEHLQHQEFVYNIKVS